MFRAEHVHDPLDATRTGAVRAKRAVVQRRLLVGSSDDPLEAQADEVARWLEPVLAGSGGGRVQPLPGPEFDGGDASMTHRQVLPRRERVQPKVLTAAGPEGGPVDPATEARLRRHSGGAPLDGAVRPHLEQALGADLSRVRLHADSHLAPQLGAEAFTHGSNIHFAPGRFQPSTSRGRNLLGHELAHVVQQGAAPQLRRKFAARMTKETFLAMLDVSDKARSLKNHIPSTGLGRFDAEYLHASNQLVVTVRPFFEFCQTAGAAGVVPGGWLKADEDDFVAKFKQQAEAAWTGKYRFTCIKPGFTDLSADVVVRVVRAPDAASAHFHHRIQKTRGMATGIGREQASDPTQINVGNFVEADKTVRPHDSATTCAGIASHDQGRLMNLIEAHKVNPIRFVNDGRNQIDPASRARLDAFVQAAMRTERPGSVPIPLVAIGKRNAREAAERGNAAQDRANAVKAYIDAKPLKYKPCETKLFDDVVDAQEAVYKSKKSKLSKDAEKAKLDPLKARQRHREVELSVKDDFVWPGDPYSILAHEFGHMLGNPDEYFEYGSATVRDAKVRQLQATGQVEDLHLATKIAAAKVSGTDSHIAAQEPAARLAEESGTDMPEFGPKTSSIMSAGADVLPVHYTPLWEALALITGDVLKKSDWQIT